MPPMPNPEPQGPDIAEDLRAAMAHAGYSQRSLAAELQRRRPRNEGDTGRGVESWRNTLGKYLKADEAKRQVPDQETAELLAEILGKPAAYFVRRRGGAPLHERIRQLEEENRRLRQQLARRRKAGG